MRAAIVESPKPPMTTALRRSDLSDALVFVREAGQAPDSHAFRRHVLEQLPRLVPTTMISYNDISPEGDPLLLLDPRDAWTEQREGSTATSPRRSPRPATATGW